MNTKRHSCDLDMLSDCPACAADLAAAKPAPPSAGEGDALRGSSECPICANSSPHQHTGVEVAEYRVATTNALARIQQLPDVYADFRAWADQHMPHNPRGWETWLAAHDRYSATPTPQSGEAASVSKVLDAAMREAMQDGMSFVRIDPADVYAPASPQGVSGDEMRVAFERWVTTVWRPDDGEALLRKRYPAFAFAAWKAALTAAGAAPEGWQQSMRAGPPPEPVSHPNQAWCDAYADWYEAATPNPGAQHGQEGR